MFSVADFGGSLSRGIRRREGRSSAQLPPNRSESRTPVPLPATGLVLQLERSSCCADARALDPRPTPY
jgi:hypothetical protein